MEVDKKTYDLWANRMDNPELLSGALDRIKGVLGNRIEEIRADKLGIHFISNSRIIMSVYASYPHLRVSFAPAAGLLLQEDETFDVARYNFWETTWRMTHECYTGMSIWITDEDHLDTFEKLLERIKAGVG
ncbi:hypothetical protein GF359_00250 [candidate division WOR-3 bacterium]|uniref:Uncharacterized protein n=1 Tax=candidate division WOR-3 bacterium TaxID=2052148 RepID=A0A9D5K7N9_UNCW3|nr:hypothetical protein [candidate division WOR-3 bacterium]MBD3363624.1 hypothetical protein [candidate division WOR-3 bacterium]